MPKIDSSHSGVNNTPGGPLVSRSRNTDGEDVWAGLVVDYPSVPSVYSPCENAREQRIAQPSFFGPSPAAPDGLSFQAQSHSRATAPLKRSEVRAIPAFHDTLRIPSPIKRLEATGGHSGPAEGREKESEEDMGFDLIDDESAPVAKKGGSDAIYELIALQTFAGYWKLDTKLMKTVGVTEDKAVPPNGCKPNVWATILAIAYLEAEMVAEKDIWELVVEKALDWMDTLEGVKEKDLNMWKTVAAVIGGHLIGSELGEWTINGASHEIMARYGILQ